MNNNNEYSENTPHVTFFAEKSELNHELVNLLTNQDFKVLIKTRNINHWSNLFSDSKKIRIENTAFNRNNKHNENYLIFDFFTDFGNQTLQDRVKLFKKHFQKENIFNKTLIIFPYELNSNEIKIIDLFLAEIDSDSKQYFSYVFIGDVVVTGKIPRLKGKDYYYLSSSQEVANQIVRCLFSLKAFGKKVAILGKPIGKTELLKRLKDFLVQEQKLIVSGETFINCKVDEFIYTKDDPDLLINEMANSLSAVDKITVAEKRKRMHRKFKSELPKISYRGLYKFRFILISVLFTFFLFPLFFLISGTFLGYLGKEIILKGEPVKSDKYLEKSLFLTNISSKYSLRFAKLPLVGRLYKDVSKLSDLSNNQSEIGLKISKISKLYFQIFEKIVDDKVYNLDPLTKELSLELINLYEMLGFLESESHEAGYLSKKLLNENFNGYNIHKVRQLSLMLGNLSNNLPEILGKETPVKYAIFFQNNALPRPTGGTLDAFAIVTFSGGKIVDWSVYESSETDSKIAGQVDPPEPLKKYYGIEKWYLRDSNWDLNFSVSATKAEWFLDKQLDLALNGVVFVGTDFISKTLDLVGEIPISDNRKINNENFRELFVNQNEYPKNSENKELSTFLDELLKKTMLLEEDRFTLAYNMVNSIRDKDIQIFLHNNSSQKVLSSYFQDNMMGSDTCGDNCYKDSILIDESVLSGDSESIKREAEMFSSIEEGVVKRKLMYYYENNGSVNYAFYFRLRSEADAGFSPVEVITNDKKETINSDIYASLGSKVAGVPITLKPKSSVAIVVNWESAEQLDFNKEGGYFLNIFKQPGINPYPLYVQVKTPEYLTISSDKSINLTLTGTYGYNTMLQDDESLHLFWKNE